MIRIFGKIYVQNDLKGFKCHYWREREKERSGKYRLERGKGESRLYRELAVNF